MSNEEYFGKGNASLYDEYMDFINYVFGFNGNTNDFKKLLPKLYKEENHPCESSYVALENGKIKAAIGAFDHDISVCGHYIKTRGIGNVAVHPYTRSRGYMKKLMNMALDDMIADGVALSVLGGRRQRYNYFSYDKAGYVVSLSLNADNMRHVFGTDRCHDFSFAYVSADDAEMLRFIHEMNDNEDFHAVRPADKLFDILSSWKQKIIAAYVNDKLEGYCVFKDDTVSEIHLLNEDRIADFSAALYDFIGKDRLSFKIPPFKRIYIDKMLKICEFYDVEPYKSFSVLNYKTVISAFMELKGKYSVLPDGILVLLIHGRGGDENIAVEVKNRVVSVTDTQREPDLTLEHLEAMNLLFASINVERDSLPDFARIWFPLPIFLYCSDGV